MDRSYVAENDAGRQRLKTLLTRVSDADMASRLGQHWTVSVALMHLSFWDRLWLAKFEEWERTGVVKMPPADTEGNPAAMNDAMLAWWRSISPPQARHEVIAAAEAIDSVAARLPESIVAAILAARPRTLIRGIHRREHLDEIERALAS